MIRQQNAFRRFHIDRLKGLAGIINHWYVVASIINGSTESSIRKIEKILIFLRNENFGLHNRIFSCFQSIIKRFSVSTKKSRQIRAITLKSTTTPFVVYFYTFLATSFCFVLSLNRRSGNFRESGTMTRRKCRKTEAIKDNQSIFTLLESSANVSKIK